MVPKVRTCWSTRPSGPSRRTQVTTVFLWTSRPAQQDEDGLHRSNSSQGLAFRPEDLGVEQTALRAPRTTGATGWGAPGPGQTFERARSTKVGDGLVPVRIAKPIGTEAEPIFMGLRVPEPGMRDFRDAYPSPGCAKRFWHLAWATVIR